VTECAPDEPPGLPGITIDEAMAALRSDWVDILKIDIEGAEAEVFSGAVGWLARVGTVAVEIHGRDCKDIVYDAFRSTGQWQISHWRELTRFLNMVNGRA
jgi:hypothetical protein